MNAIKLFSLSVFVAASFSVQAGPLDPECTAEKAAKSAAAKATVGVGGRCKPAEAAKDTAKNAAGIEEKSALEKHVDKDDSAADKVKEKAKDAKNTAKSAAGIEDKSEIEKRVDKDGSTADKMKEKTKDAKEAVSEVKK